MSRITERIRSINANGKKAVIPYIPAGFPNKETFWKLLEEMDAQGVAAIEIGIPFSDPVADGSVVEAAALQCLADGVTLAWTLDALKAHRGKIQAPLLFMGYYNSFLHYGLEKFAQEAADAGLAGMIIPDLPFEESEGARKILNDAGIDLIPLVGINTPMERLKRYAEVEQGFVYFVSVLGTTGVRDGFAEELKECLQLARSCFSIPLALGFGIKTPSQIDSFGDLIDAGVIGSSLLQHIEKQGEVVSFFKK